MRNCMENMRLECYGISNGVVIASGPIGHYSIVKLMKTGINLEKSLTNQT